jgi:hypothetical protein
MPELRQSWVAKAARTDNIDMLHRILDLVSGHSLDKDPGLIVPAYRTACAAGHVAMVRDLLDKGLANAKQDAPAFLQAIESGNRGIIKLLVERGASRLTCSLWPTIINATNISVYRLTEFLIGEGFPVTDEAAQAIGELYNLYGCLSDDQLAATVTICDNIHETQGPEVGDELYHRYVRSGLPWYSYVADASEPLSAEEMEEP